MKKKIFIMIMTILALSAFQLFNADANNIPTFNFYETTDNTPNGTSTETGGWVVLGLPPMAAGDGYAILLETGSSTNANNWSDVVQIVKGQQFLAQPQARLLSDVNEGPNSAWPALAEVLSTNHLFVQETSPPTSFSWSFTNFDGTETLVSFYVYSDAPEAAPVPEPATIMLLGSGLIGLAGYGRKKFFKK